MMMSEGRQRWQKSQCGPVERVMVMMTRRTSDKVIMVSVAMMIAMERKVMNWS
jgi:hypothetical protein